MCAMSSSEIAQLNQAFSNQSMARMQYSGMISPDYNFGGMNTRAGHEHLAAKGLNTGAAVAAPLMSAGMGLMMLDPLSIGLRAGGAASGMGLGVGGSAAIGMAAGGVALGGVAAAAYMGNQVMSGMQQAQQFNNSMRSSYSFFNPNSQTGRGFASGDIREIGGNIRNMAGGHMGGMGGGGDSYGSVLNQFQTGPGFAELGRLASSMGRMGLADGVRNAKDFNEKFRQMIKTVTTIATDMGTTLEEAQKAMASMKGSGIFKGQGGVASAIRSASVSGGLATTEVTGMMNVGSQISRMFGGTGRQGAMGGIEAISQVGTAVQTGALSEEDIYNATGQTGAEGRRALAQQQMIQTGSFLKGGKGRWLLASLAGKNGHLDADSVSDFMAGGMGVNDTRNAAHRNLSGVGKADFTRNEGRLRGAVMEQFGGLAPAMAMMGWAQQSGIDINSMGDKDMLFMQRQMGMGRDEADTLVKMARKMPQLLQARREAKEDDASVQERGIRSRDSGLSDVKRKLEAARDSVNNEMQKAGQSILESATDAVARWGNEIAGTYEEHSIAGIREAVRAAELGGSHGSSNINNLLGGKMIRSLGGTTPGGSLHEDVGQRNYINRVKDLQFSARLGSVGSLSGDMSKLVSDNTSSLLNSYAKEGGLSSLGGEDRMAGFKRMYGKDTELGKRYRAMDARGQASFMQQMEGQIGIKNGRLSESFEDPGLAALRGGGEFHTEADRQTAIGRTILGGVNNGTKGSGVWGRTLDYIKGGADATTTDVSHDNIARAAGAYIDTKDYRGLANGVLSGDDESGDNLNKAIANLKGSASGRADHSLTSDEKGQLGDLKQLRLTADYMKVVNSKGGVDKLSDTDWDKLISQRKATAREIGEDDSSVTRDSIKSEAQGVSAANEAQRAEVVAKVAKQVSTDARSNMNVGLASGLTEVARVYSGPTKRGKESTNIDAMQLTDKTIKDLQKAGGAAAVQAGKLAIEAQNVSIDAGKATDPEKQRQLDRLSLQKSGQLSDAMGNMDVKSLKAFGSKFAGTSYGGQASELLMSGMSLNAAAQKHGAIGAIAGTLGVDMNPDEMAALKGKSGAVGAAAIAGRLGVSKDAGFVSSLAEAIDAANKKGGGIKGAHLLEVAKANASPETQKALAEKAKGEETADQKIVEKLTEGNRFLQAMVLSSGASTSALNSLVNAANKPDAEATKPAGK